ncbi:MAG: hypothetical protein IJA67_01295 [Oscillospiraceae bacterium]|nr:hypothetical protein [Oscillospiraceae bacterium]
MNRDEILELSRKENQNKDLAELEVAAKAGNIASRVGACVCCILSLIVHAAADILLYSPWVIYFSILGTHYAVKYKAVRRSTDLYLCVVYFAMCLLAFVFFTLRLVEVVG